MREESQIPQSAGRGSWQCQVFRLDTVDELDESAEQHKDIQMKMRKDRQIVLESTGRFLQFVREFTKAWRASSCTTSCEMPRANFLVQVLVLGRWVVLAFLDCATVPCGLKKAATTTACYKKETCHNCSEELELQADVHTGYLNNSYR